MKYNEDLILRDVKDYISSTYKQHYAGEDGIQVNDLIMSIGCGQGAFISNAIEYLARYGKKEGSNVQDLYKAIHNIIFLIYLNHRNENPKQMKMILSEDLELIEKIYQKELERKGL
jgi:hypothetical protein